MDSLPLELITNVFLYLNLRQKIQCMLVCRHWTDVIKSKGLLETVDICNLHALKRFLQHLHYEPTQGLQVKHLTIRCDFYQNFRSRELCNFFPNLKTICLKHSPDRYGFYTIEEIEPLKRLECLRNQMTDIIDFGDCDFTYYLLSLGICSQLTTLTLDMEDTQKTTTRIIRLLKNSPSLLKLTMYNPVLTLHDLECLINYLSRLQSLKMEYVQFFKSRSNIIYPIAVTPSSSVKILSLSVLGMDSNLKYFLLDYIRRKFSCLEDLSLCNSGRLRFKRSMELWPENDTDEEDQEHQEHQELEYQDDIADMSVWSPFVQHYGDQLKSFGLQSLQNEPDLITEMDQAGCRLGKLSVYNVGQIPLVDLLSQSKQCTYIQELVLLNINNNMPLEPLQQMTCLGTLKMSFTKKCGFGYINFNRLLNICCDRLTSLMLENLGLELDTDVKQQYGLKKLELNSNDLPDGFVSFLSHHIQNLRHLTLSGRLPLHMSLDLPKLHLSSFNLKKSSSEGTLYFSIVSLADKTSRSYASCHYDENDGYLNSLTETYGSSVCAVMPPTCLDLSSHKQTFVLVCASVQNVILNNYLAC